MFAVRIVLFVLNLTAVLAIRSFLLDGIVLWHTEFVVQHIISSLFRLGSGMESAIKQATCQRIYVDTAARRGRVQHNQIQKKLKVI